MAWHTGAGCGRCGVPGRCGGLGRCGERRGCAPAGVRTLDAQRQWIVQEMDHFGVRLNLEGAAAAARVLSVRAEGSWPDPGCRRLQL